MLHVGRPASVDDHTCGGLGVGNAQQLSDTWSIVVSEGRHADVPEDRRMTLPVTSHTHVVVKVDDHTTRVTEDDHDVAGAVTHRTVTLTSDSHRTSDTGDTITDH